MKRVKKIITSVLVGTMMIAQGISVSAKSFDSNTVYLSNAKENEYASNGVIVHEYIWNEKSNNIARISELDDAEWMKTEKDNGYTIKHRAAREYKISNGHSVWDAAAESKSYNKSGKLDGPIKTTVKVVNALLTWTVYETQTSGWRTGHSHTRTKTGFLANEPLFSMRSYWSTEK